MRARLSSVVASQISTHATATAAWVQELASREHLCGAIVPVVRARRSPEAHVTHADLDAIAVTVGSRRRPGVPARRHHLCEGAGVRAQGCHSSPVNHLEGHIHAVLLGRTAKEDPRVPQGL